EATSSTRAPGRRRACATRRAAGGVVTASSGAKWAQPAFCAALKPARGSMARILAQGGAGEEVPEGVVGGGGLGGDSEEGLRPRASGPGVAAAADLVEDDLRSLAAALVGAADHARAVLDLHREIAHHRGRTALVETDPGPDGGGHRGVRSGDQA